MVLHRGNARNLTTKGNRRTELIIHFQEREEVKEGRTHTGAEENWKEEGAAERK